MSSRIVNNDSFGPVRFNFLEEQWAVDKKTCRLDGRISCFIEEELLRFADRIHLGLLVS
jgi:hypothetical protein